MKAKFKCSSVIQYEGQSIATLNAVQRNDVPENTQFNTATPAGKLEINVTNPSALDYFKAGKSYYLDFSEANQ